MDYVTRPVRLHVQRGGKMNQYLQSSWYQWSSKLISARWCTPPPAHGILEDSHHAWGALSFQERTGQWVGLPLNWSVFLRTTQVSPPPNALRGERSTNQTIILWTLTTRLIHWCASFATRNAVGQLVPVEPNYVSFWVYTFQGCGSVCGTF